MSRITATPTLSALPISARAPAGATNADPAGRGAPVSRQLLHALELLRQAQSTDVQLAVEIAEQGLRLIAWTGKMDREDRVRLRSEMARLAASYGFAAAEISVNGRVDAAPAKPGEE